MHRDALSAAALRFEATPLPPRVFVGPSELPLCAALMVGGSISHHPPPTENYGSGNQRLRRGFEPPTALRRSPPEVTAIFTTDRNP